MLAIDIPQADLRVARVDTAALAHNLTVLARTGIPLVDVSCDAYGHGASAVGDVATQLGLGTAAAVDGVAPADAETTAAVYGISGDEVRPVMRLSGRVVSVKRVRAGEGVSYGYTHRFERDGLTAMVALGYADGLHRHAGNRATLLLAGAQRPIVGRVAMDVCVLWLDEDDSARLGDEAVAFGDPAEGETPLARWAESLRVDPLAVTAGLGPRVRRIAR